MRQILQNLRTGRTELVEVPDPAPRRGFVRIRTTRSVISPGTERSLVEFGRASLLAKARSRPDKVRQVLDKIRADGLLPTLEAVFKRLDEPLPLGYSGAGVVLDVGEDVAGIEPGDRVASNGPHAEIVCVPRNCCAKIPDGVTDDQAAFTVLAAVALQGMRLVAPTFGERIAVIGLGLIGQVAVQLALAAGCEVLAVDVDAFRGALAGRHGAATAVAGQVTAVAAAQAWSGGLGADGVLIAASARTDEIVHQAAAMCRKRGRIVLVGVVGLGLRREDFYEKELTFQVSCSYGPGRYDEDYEQRGRDYPLPFVRWTEQRNFEAVLGAMRSGGLAVDDLITDRVGLADAAAAYERLCSGGGAMGVLLEYAAAVRQTRQVRPASRRSKGGGPAVVGVIGAGNYSRMTLLPALARTPAAIAYVADLDGPPAAHLARKYGAESAVTDYALLLGDERVNGVIISVRHGLHARLVCEALAAGKHVLVEKPLAVDAGQVRQVLSAAAEASDRMLMVGFNRRFSPHAAKMAELLAGRAEPLAMSVTVNAGAIAPGHWVHDPASGGGRIIGEGCHFIDLMVHLAASPVTTVAATRMGGPAAVKDDKTSISLGFADGSVGTLNYFANGPKGYAKEVVEVFSQQRLLRLENFRVLRGYGFGAFRKFRTIRQDKGHHAQYAAFVRRIAEGGEPPIPLADLVNVTLASFAAMSAAAEHRTVVLAEEYPELIQAAAEP